MPHGHSPTLTNLSHYFRLDDADAQLLNTLEGPATRVVNKYSLWPANGRVERLFAIRSGWACTFRDDAEGNRQVIDVLLPGDIIGLRDLTFATHASEARMITEGVVCSFPHVNIVDVFERSTPLAMALVAAFARQEAAITERLLMISRRSARARIAHFVIETQLRLNRIQATDLRDFFMPLSQKLLGEILGLTSVHVCRSLNDMERDGVLSKQRRRIQVHDCDKLYEEAGLDARYLSDDIGGLHARLQESRPRTHHGPDIDGNAQAFERLVSRSESPADDGSPLP
ncbi:MAG: Crp/FNR family transcriptional regulator [Halomonadaceae bacterium T82-2]|nr:MAG: Crp/FNR family transcriptional regulator [Halomonadaceae bacterium T82-2]